MDESVTKIVYREECIDATILEFLGSYCSNCNVRNSLCTHSDILYNAYKLKCNDGMEAITYYQNINNLNIQIGDTVCVNYSKIGVIDNDSKQEIIQESFEIVL